METNKTWLLASFLSINQKKKFNGLLTHICSPTDLIRPAKKRLFYWALDFAEHLSFFFMV